MSNEEKNLEEGLINVTEIVSDYLRILRKMWAWFIIFSLIGASVFYFRARSTYVPMYTASATYTVNMSQDVESESNTFFDNKTAKQMAITFPYILTSGVLKRKIEEELGPVASTSSIKAEVLEDTNLLTISVTDRDADRAYTVLNSVVEHYPSVAEVIVGNTYMQLLDESGIPAYPDNPKEFSKDAARGAAVGIMLVAIWSVYLLFTRRTVRKEEDVKRRLNNRCLGAVPQVAVKRRSKMVERPKILLTNEKVEDQLEESFRMIRNKVEYHAREYQQKIFLITSAVAGEGKSTVAVNLALALARDGHKVTLIDSDLRHPTNREIFGLEEGPGLVDVLKRQKKLNECILTAKSLNLGEDMDLFFVPGGQAVADGSVLLGSPVMNKVIEHVKSRSDYVILDCAPAGLITDAVVLAQYAEAAIFVVRKDFARVSHIMDGMEHLAESHIQIAGCIMNGV